MSQAIVKIFTTFGVLQIALCYANLDAAPQAQNSAKAELLNVSLQNLNFKYLKHLYPDHTFLKISNSKIDKIEWNAFDAMSHLNLLEISNSEVKTPLDSLTFLRLRGLEILVLKNIGLENLHLNLSNVQELILTQNNIEVLDGDTITGREVNYLDVSDNKIRKLVGSFQHLIKLSMIDLSRNQIAQIGNIFYHNLNLKRILAAGNKLTNTEGVNFPWVKTLDLFSNKIAILDADSFPNMTALEELVLAFNNINHLDNPFDDLIELKILNLGWNLIEEMHPSLFRNNLYLTKLELQGNKIRSLDRFESVHHHLTHLDLSHNQISLISDEFFQSMPNLQSLDLSFNHLKTLTDSLAPLRELRILNLAFNNLVMNGYEFSLNSQLIRVNLSKNNLEIGLVGFKNNRLLTYLDVSSNNIVNFCDENTVLENLMKVNLRENNVKSVACLKKLKSLCEVDLRDNPLICGNELDSVTLGLARTGGSPFAVANFHSDLVNNQCELLTMKRSFLMWNAVRKSLCGTVKDLEIVEKEGGKEEVTKEEMAEEELAESIEVKDVTTKKPFIVLPIGWIDKDEIRRPNPLDKPREPQSERVDWEKIDENANLLEGFEDEDNVRKSNFSWYTIVLILIGLSLTLTCFNLAVFLFIKMKLWKKAEPVSQQKYVVLHNEVYKNTTEPSINSQAGGEWFVENQTRNKIFSYGKINELLLNFGLNKKDKDSESLKNVLISNNT